MQRATWTAAEILGEYQHDIESFEFVMGGSGDFEFSIDGRPIYSKKQTGEYPDIKLLKKSVVDAIEVRSAG